MLLQLLLRLLLQLLRSTTAATPTIVVLSSWLPLTPSAFSPYPPKSMLMGLNGRPTAIPSVCHRVSVQRQRPASADSGKHACNCKSRAIVVAGDRRCYSSRLRLSIKALRHRIVQTLLAAAHYWTLGVEGARYRTNGQPTAIPLVSHWWEQRRAAAKIAAPCTQISTVRRMAGKQPTEQERVLDFLKKSTCRRVCRACLFATRPSNRRVDRLN